MTIITTSVVGRHRELLAMSRNPPRYSAMATVQQVRSLGPPELPRPKVPPPNSARASLERMLQATPEANSAVAIVRAGIARMSHPPPHSAKGAARAIAARYVPVLDTGNALDRLV